MIEIETIRLEIIGLEVIGFEIIGLEVIINIIQLIETSSFDAKKYNNQQNF